MRKKLASIDQVLLSRILFIAVIGIALFFASTTVYFYNKSQTKKAVLSVEAQKDPPSVIEAVGRLIDPPAEEPAVATVSDKSQLPYDDFFKKAENGDKVIVYPNAGKALIYRPGTNKIIEFGPADLQMTSTETTTSDAPPASSSAEAPQSEEVVVSPRPASHILLNPQDGLPGTN